MAGKVQMEKNNTDKKSVFTFVPQNKFYGIQD